MEKIETIFKRDPSNMKLVTREVNPDIDLTDADHWSPTWKIDGSACLVREGVLYRRHALKRGKAKPPGWIHWTFDPEQDSGHGWAPIGDDTADQYHREAAFCLGHLSDGTYELVGPKIQGNPYGLDRHVLWAHGQAIRDEVPATDYDAVRAWLEANVCEGIVWWLNGRPMAKIKRRDFGLPWPVKA